MQIVTENLSYVYSEKSKELAFRALKDISLTVEEGDFFGIIGQTGSGKSTFIQHLNGLLKIQKNRGSIVIGDFNLADKKCNFKKLRSHIGMVFQYPEYQLFAESVYEDVAFGIKNFFPETPREETEKMVEEALTMVGFDYASIKDKSPFELSGGQKRRVAIAGVIVTRPEILVLDEPAAGLDPAGKKEFLSLLKELKGKSVKTIIIVSHDMNIISEYCNRAALFSDGKVIKCGTPKEVFSDADELAESGLELPVTGYLTERLKSAGKEIKNDLTVDGFVSAFVSAYKGGAGK